MTSTSTTAQPELREADEKVEPPEVPGEKTPPQPLFPPVQPPPPGFIASRWPGPGDGAGPAAWVSALVGAAAFAIALPLTRPGIGWLLVGLVCALAVGHAARFGPKPDQLSERLIRIGWTVLGLALLCVGVFLNAYWL